MQRTEVALRTNDERPVGYRMSDGGSTPSLKPPGSKGDDSQTPIWPLKRSPRVMPASGHRRSTLERSDNRLAPQIIEQRIWTQDASTKTTQVDAAIGHAMHKNVVCVDPAVARDQ